MGEGGEGEHGGGGLEGKGGEGEGRGGEGRGGLLERKREAECGIVWLRYGVGLLFGGVDSGERWR